MVSRWNPEVFWLGDGEGREVFIGVGRGIVPVGRPLELVSVRRVMGACCRG